MKINWNQQHPDQALVILGRAEMEQQHPDLMEKAITLRKKTDIHICKVILYQGVLSGTFVIPEKNHPIASRDSFGFIMTGENLYFIGEEKKTSELLNRFINSYDLVLNSPFMFLLWFLNFIIQEDIYFLEEYNTELEKIEEDIFKGNLKGMENFIMTTRKDMNILASYYLQMSAVAEELQETDMAKDDTEESGMISLFASRVSRLLSMVESIKDYTSQIWNLRQTQLSDKQNKISTLLTIVTAIFLPLTLITGWFGMNFENMPLIHEKNGYYIIVGVCVLIILVEVLTLHHMHWLNFDRDSDNL